MNLKLKELYEMQYALDANITSKHDNASYDKTRNKRILALIVELAELVNETRCFKYWTLKPPADKPVILEEYVDGIHFLLSLGFYFDTQIDKLESIEYDIELSEAFIEMNICFSSLLHNFTYDNYLKCFAKYLGIATLLNISEEDILEFYIMKNKKNYERQINNY